MTDSVESGVVGVEGTSQAVLVDVEAVEQDDADDKVLVNDGHACGQDLLVGQPIRLLLAAHRQPTLKHVTILYCIVKRYSHLLQLSNRISNKKVFVLDDFFEYMKQGNGFDLLVFVEFGCFELEVTV